MSGVKALGLGKRSSMGCIISSSGALEQKGRVRADLEVDISAAALLFEEKDHFRPYLQLSGDIVGMYGEFPNGVTEMRSGEGRMGSVTYTYDLSDQEIADLALKGLFREDFSLPELLETSKLVFPGTVDYSHVVVNGESVFVVSVPNAHMLHTDTEHAHIPICDFFEEYSAGPYVRQTYYDSGYYRHMEAGEDVQNTMDPSMSVNPYAMPDVEEGAILSDMTQKTEADFGSDQQAAMDLTNSMESMDDVEHEDLSAERWIPGRDEDQDDVTRMANDVVAGMKHSAQVQKLLGKSSVADLDVTSDSKSDMVSETKSEATQDVKSDESEEQESEVQEAAVRSDASVAHEVANPSDTASYVKSVPDPGLPKEDVDVPEGMIGPDL